jgi:predicted DNA binding CopG/RHH family protein
MRKKQRIRAKRIPIAEEVKDKVIRFRVTSEDFKAIHQKAIEKESTVSLFLIECIRLHIRNIT